jgi:hypothetical protein
MVSNFIGEVCISLSLIDNQVIDVKVDYHYPAIGQLLIGLTAQQALTKIQQLYSLCPIAHLQACSAVLMIDFPFSKTDIRDEWIREHSWRCWLMLDELSVCPDAIYATALLRKGKLEGAISLFGMPIEEWLAIDNKTQLQRWIDDAKSPYATLLSMLQAIDLKVADPTSVIDKSGPLRRCDSHDFIHYFDDENNAILQNTLARMFELALLLVDHVRFSPTVISSDDSVYVEAARGLLTHKVTFDQEDPQKVITAYQISAPTQKHCKANGTLERLIKQYYFLKKDLKIIKLLVHCIDPCAPFLIDFLTDKGESNA